MADEGDSLKLTFPVSEAVELATIQLALNSVIEYEARHRYRVDWTLIQKSQDLGSLALRQ